MKPTAASDVQEKSSRSLTLAAGGSGTIWLPSLLSIDLYMPHLAPASSLVAVLYADVLSGQIHMTFFRRERLHGTWQSAYESSTLFIVRECNWQKIAVELPGVSARTRPACSPFPARGHL
jgi:hypothetical protein